MPDNQLENADGSSAGDFTCAPVLVIAFNRPDLVRGLLKRIAAARPLRLFFAVDGARNEAEAELVRQTQSAVSEISWSCEVKTFFRTENRGCRNAPPEAVSWFFGEVEEGIVLEDDCYPALGFLRFASELLERYRDDGRVGAITAFNRYNLHTDAEASYHFSKELNIWAWASWRRVWEKHDVSLDRYVDRIDGIIEGHTRNRRMRRYLRKAFEYVRNGGATWDYQFGFSFIANGYLSVVPRERLVANQGIGLEASTHTGGYDFFAKDFSTAGEMSFPLVHPERVEPDIQADNRAERIMMGILPRGLTWFGSKLPRCCRPVLTLIGRGIRNVAPFLFEL